jgi:hypothetical protein
MVQSGYDSSLLDLRFTVSAARGCSVCTRLTSTTCDLQHTMYCMPPCTIFAGRLGGGSDPYTECMLIIQPMLPPNDSLPVSTVLILTLSACSNCCARPSRSATAHAPLSKLLYVFGLRRLKAQKRTATDNFLCHGMANR